VTAVPAAAAIGPFAARAQQRMPVVGFLSSGSPDRFLNAVHDFCQGLSETGYVEGRNVAIEYRWAEDQYDYCRHWPPIWFAVR
jgi:putative tryptophan/tyrosine transport system substrate-binding protein